MLCCGSPARAADVPVTFNLSPASGTVNRLGITLSAPIVSDQTQYTNLSGTISSNLNFTIDPSTRQLDSSGISGISFNYQNPGQISMSNMNYTWKVLIVTVQTANMSGLKATAYTPVPPGSVTAVDASTFNFPVTNHALEINQGNITWSGYETGSQDCTASPISGLTLNSTGTLTFNRTADSLTSSTYSIGLNMPVNFTQAINSSVTMSTSGSSLVATSTYTKNYTAAYWDTSTTAGLQGGHGVWSTTNTYWSTTTAGSNSLYAWVADGSGLDAYFTATGSSPIDVTGNVSVKSMTFGSTGYSFSGGTIAVNAGGITANQSASIASNVTLAAAQTWTTAAGATLTASGNISAGTNALTFKGLGATSLSGTNNLNLVRVGDSTGAGNLTIAGGVTTIPNNLVLGYSIAGATGSLNLNSGTLTMTGSGTSLQVGGDGGSSFPGLTGRYTQNGGVFNFNVAANTGGINLGTYGAAVVSINGGTFTSANNPLTVGIREPATFNINSALAQVTLQALKFNPQGSSFGNLGNGIVNLNAGTLSVGSVSRNSGSTATANFYFGGGTLKATSANADFMEGLTHAYVKEGGAKIDTQSYDITIGQMLEHGGTADIDGGLTKNGSGTLTLTGAISYTGDTTINAGTLMIDNGLTSNLATISGAGDLSIGSTSTLSATLIEVNSLSIGSTGLMAVPEPASLMLLVLAGLFGFAFWRVRR